MISEDEHVRLMAHFRRLGYHVERRVIGGSDTILVAGNPEVASDITVYRRSVQLHQSLGQWHTVVGGVTLPWVKSVDELRAFVSVLMGTEDAYVSERQRRLQSVSGGA